jgi:hypothetical protein
MWPFRSNKPEEEDDESVYTEEEYEEHYEYEVEVTDDEYEEGEEDNLNDASDATTPNGEMHLADGETSPEKENIVMERENVYVESKENRRAEDWGDDEGVEEDNIRGEDETADDEVTDDEEEEAEEDEGNGATEVEDEEEEAVTSMEEKHSLLALAAEHDRVDILQSILAIPEERDALLHHHMPPPLHIAVSFGSTNATSCLLRLGANPALRPEGDGAVLKKMQGLTAWELAFGTNSDDSPKSASSWFKSSDTPGSPINMAPSKREGIRHAFTAEALRCIGADEVERLQQLLESGMPPDMDIGGNKDIKGWCHEMDSKKCLELLHPETTAEEERNKTNGALPPDAPTVPPTSPLVRRLSSDMNDAESLRNRLEELETLAVGLSTYLDNLAEEVSVCHGLLLMGNGASALASHVRSLKDQLEFLHTDLQDRQTRWAATEHELFHYMKRQNKTAADCELTVPTPLHTPSLTRRLSNNDPLQLQAQLGASENRIRKLRASIADMSEESETALKEVQRRGLSGGIQLVRKLREEIRSLEFQVAEAKSGEALCRTKLQRLQNQVAQAAKSNGSSAPAVVQESVKLASEQQTVPISNGEIEQPSATPKALTEKHLMQHNELVPEAASSMNASPADSTMNDDDVPTNSEKVASGKSDALMKYNNQSSGYMPLDLWQIILRIIGLGRVAVRQNVQNIKKQSSNVMIV